MRELWIGLVEVRKGPDSEFLQGKKGAFTNVITWASTAQEFREKADKLAESLKLFVVDVEDVEPLSERQRRFVIDAKLEDIADEARQNPEAILYSTFHTYPRDDA